MNGFGKKLDVGRLKDPKTGKRKTPRVQDLITFPVTVSIKRGRYRRTNTVCRTFLLYQQTGHLSQRKIEQPTNSDSFTASDLQVLFNTRLKDCEILNSREVICDSKKLDTLHNH